MTPMIDVVFQLLIFFACASVGVMREMQLPARLAGTAGGSVAVQTQAETAEPLLVNVGGTEESPALVFAGQRFHGVAAAAAQLESIATQDPQPPLVLDIDKDAPIGLVVHVYDAGRDAGVRKIDFAADAEKVSPTRTR